MRTQPIFGRRPFSRPAGADRRFVGVASTATTVSLLFATALVTSWLAVLDSRFAWVVAAVVAVVVGAISTSTRARFIALALVPVSSLTSSAIVPFDGRYIPVLLLTGALFVAMRGRIGAGLVLARRLPRAFVVSVLAYLGWATVATLSSVSFGEIQYLGGMLATLGAALLATPILLSSENGLRKLSAVIAISAAALLASGLVLAGVGGITLFGHVVGVYFIEELVVAGTPTGIVFPQNYGPFVGPATESLAFAIAASAYLAGTSRGRVRSAWWAIAVFCLVGLASTFSREGILMAVLATGTITLGWIFRRQVVPGSLALTGVLLVLFAASTTGAIGVLGRMDLVRNWYGEEAVAILMNPVIPDRGQVPVEPELPNDGLEIPPAGPGTLPGSAGGQEPPIGSSVPPIATPVVPDVIELKTSSSFEARLSLWRAAYRASLDAPLLGHGLGSNSVAIVPYLNGQDARLRGASTHSTVMRMLVELGIPGLLSYLVVIAVTIWMVIKSLWRSSSGAVLPMAGIVVASIAHQLFGTLLLGGLTYGSYAFVVALGLLARSVGEPSATRNRARNKEPRL
jgi:hypothetical protein